ncbi:FAD dependent oxidoreductase [Segniliparus rotundus DSM 44985]|uniref:FAD dependent oxidoreductase n=1 Tax=Segniliparus rotundus (strain ATCC BAA-972 / CDC 1076 / CIP 108378 / DSM 44985 / JCM 13578) TaxID=640132 RepID=D6Z945_SEGRD|nr:FAD-dependent monooxygenase [Segniliparus rotundus]ADG98475.1 FAD dependent oxidoreductase [Segniliparus rotundus DSM 44985]
MSTYRAPLRVLVCGGAIAGPAIAFWLARAGHTVTIVEQSATLRGGGHAVDFRGPSLTVLEKMGVLPQVRAQATNMGPTIRVDAQGKEIARLPAEVTGGELEIVWSDLVRILHDTVRGDVRYRFGVRITHIADLGEHVDVVLSDGSAGSYDFVVGADGLHSGVRSLVFGPESELVAQLGRIFCLFSVENHLKLDHLSMDYRTPDGRVVLQGDDPDKPARANLWLIEPDVSGFDHRDAQKAKQLFAERFADGGWETPRILEALAAADPVYFDTLAQVRLTEYSKGRVVLLGDAAWCASPRSGMGTSLAIVGAYVLAHELLRANGDHVAAFARYQQLLKPYVERCQRLALDGIRADTPTTAFGRFKRRLTLWSLRLPGVSERVARQSLAVGRSFALPEYSGF